MDWKEFLKFNWVERTIMWTVAILFLAAFWLILTTVVFTQQVG
jgi:hypothetical protein